MIMRINRARELQFGGPAMAESFQRKSMPNARPAWCAALILWSFGCASSPPGLDRALIADPVPLAHEQEVARHYRISCPDLLVLTVEERPDLSGRRRVNPDGRIDLAPLGRLRVEGQSPDEVGRDVARAAGVPEQMVRVQVAEYRSQQVYLFGQFNGLQRAVPYRGEETVFDLLRRVGGIAPGAEPTEIYVLRSNIAEGKRPEVFPVDLRAIVLKGDQRTNLRLEPGDQVFIGETRTSSLKKCVPPFLLPLYESLCGLYRPAGTSRTPTPRDALLP